MLLVSRKSDPVEESEYNSYCFSCSIRNASVSVNLQAGVYYYYEILQLSSDQQNKLDFHFQMICQDGSELCTSQPIQSTYLQAKIPSKFILSHFA